MVRHLAAAFVVSFLVAGYGEVPWPTVFYDFDDGQGTTVRDSGRAGNNGAFSGSLLAWSTTDGIYSGTSAGSRGCVRFLDSTWAPDHIQSPYIPEYNATSEYTISVWIRWSGAKNYGYLFWRVGTSHDMEPSTGGDLYDAWISPGPVKIMCTMETTISRMHHDVSAEVGSFNIFDGNWHWIVLSFKDMTQKVYGDGVELSTFYLTDPPKGNTTDNLWLGARPGRAGFPAEGVRMKGHMDRFRFWNQELTPEQITEIYQSEGPSGGTGTVVWTNRTVSVNQKMRQVASSQNHLKPVVFLPGARAGQLPAKVYDARGRQVTRSSAPALRPSLLFCTK